MDIELARKYLHTRRARRGGFTLAEILVVLALILVLGATVFPQLSSARERAHQSKCALRMHDLSLGIFAWSADHAFEFPRSSHSAGGYGQPGWAKSILPYIGEKDNPSKSEWKAIQSRLFRCPSDRKRTAGSSYGLNVFFELDPGFDDYEGSPEQWRTFYSVPKPIRTILMAEVPASADHVMSHFWEPGGTGFDVDYKRHGNKSNYLFADGHTEHLAIEATFDPAKGINLWNPSLAR